MNKMRRNSEEEVAPEETSEEVVLLREISAKLGERK
ncbi:hypothetical protein MBO_00425 [Moraxella bovoculi 237]|uniref:Uncharacterized protein n=1 Tax=Moraxella bovoculi 237 TaxID=743974 RepID=A0A066UFD4_9GAMM|nr:hypothetical protein MBO_00425 [Moraxella bovoculi 237]